MAVTDWVLAAAVTDVAEELAEAVIDSPMSLDSTMDASCYWLQLKWLCFAATTTELLISTTWMPFHKCFLIAVIFLYVVRMVFYFCSVIFFTIMLKSSFKKKCMRKKQKYRICTVMKHLWDFFNVCTTRKYLSSKKWILPPTLLSVHHDWRKECFPTNDVWHKLIHFPL